MPVQRIVMPDGRTKAYREATPRWIIERDKDEMRRAMGIPVTVTQSSPPSLRPPLTTRTQQAAMAGDPEARNYTLYLVAKKPGEDSAAGHVFIGGQDPQGTPMAKGFHPSGGGLLSKYASDGITEDDTEDFSKALSGDKNYAVKPFKVNQETYERAMTYMQNYSKDEDYNLFWNNCIAAALKTLNHSGVTPSFFVPFSQPHQIYDAIKKGF